MSWRVAMATILGLAGILGATIARGDGGCDKGSRDTTAEERAVMTAALETARKALPPAPEGWIIRGDDVVQPILDICKDYESGPWSYDFIREYERVTGFEARDSLLTVAVDIHRSEMEDKQPRIDAITARIEQLTEKLTKAAEKGDMAAIESIQKELEKESAAFSALMEEGEAGAAVKAVEEAERDAHFQIIVRVNTPSMWHDPSATTLDIPGATAAYRWGEGEDGQALILVGPWKSTDESLHRYEARSAKAEVPQAVAIQVRADATRIDSVVRAIDVRAMAAMLKR